MFFGRIASLVLSYTAIVSLFTYIEIASDWAFWILVGAYLLWLAVHSLGRGGPLLMLSIVLTLAAIVGVFVEIPIVSKFAFWVMAANYILVVAGTGSIYLFVFKS